MRVAHIPPLPSDVRLFDQATAGARRGQSRYFRQLRSCVQSVICSFGPSISLWP